MRIRINLLLIILGLTVFGCSNNNYQKALKDVTIQQNTENLQISQRQLADAAISINGALLELAAIQKAVYPATKLPDMPDANKIGMGRLASVDWTGPIEPLAKNIADLTNYKIRILGKPPAIPIIVAVNVKNVPIAVILRNAAYQCGNRANIVVYPSSHVLELRYARV